MSVAEIGRRRRPYAATANVVAVLNRVRTRNLPEIVDNGFLRIAGIPEVVLSRVSEALVFLNFIDEDGSPTDRLRALAAAPDYQAILGDAVREAYRDDFANVDPAKDTQASIITAFQQYEPRSQTSRMVMLFLGLCRESRISVKDAPRDRKMQPASRRREGERKHAIHDRGGIGRRQAEVPTAGHLFGVTEDDIAALNESEFNEVWAALGKVVRAKARAKQRLVEAPGTEDDARGEEE